RAAALRRPLEDKEYGEPLRQHWRTLRQERDALPVDEAAYERLRAEAPQATACEAQLRDLEQVAGRRDELDTTIARLERQETAARTQLADGSAFRPLQDQSDQLRAQLAKIDFSPRRFDEVRQALRDLGEAGPRHQRLLGARENHAE